MYYIVYGLFYLLSLLPWRVMYVLSDAIYALVYYIFGYRKDVVMQNLNIAFPEKTEKEKIRIAKDFYHNLIDNFIEMIKLISITKKEFEKRFSSNVEIINDLYDTGINIEFLAGHFFNWEMVNYGAALTCKYPFVGVYMPLDNKVFDKIIYDIRVKYKSILIPTSEFKTKFHTYVRGRYALGLAADQRPSNPNKSYWIKFFDRLTPFIPGPEKGAKKNNTAIVFAHFYKTKRGYFRTDCEIITTTPNEFKDGELTKIFANKVEQAVKKIPANYLWTHKRWKFQFDPEKHQHLVIE